RHGGHLRRPVLDPAGDAGERPGRRGQRVAGAAAGDDPADAPGAARGGGDPRRQRAEGLRPGAGAGPGVGPGRCQRAEPGDVPHHVHQAQRRAGQTHRGAAVHARAAGHGVAGTGAAAAGGDPTMTFVSTTVPKLRPAGTVPPGPPPPPLTRRLTRRLGEITARVLVLTTTLVWIFPTLGLAVASLRTSA